MKLFVGLLSFGLFSISTYATTPTKWLVCNSANYTMNVVVYPSDELTAEYTSLALVVGDKTVTGTLPAEGSGVRLHDKYRAFSGTVEVDYVANTVSIRGGYSNGFKGYLINEDLSCLERSLDLLNR